MFNFQNYHDLRQAGYDPKEVGSGYLRTIRKTLKDYANRIGNKTGGMWDVLKTNIQELYGTLSSQHDMNTLSQEVERHIAQLGFTPEDRMQEGIRLNIIRMLNELRDHIAEMTGQV